MRPLNNIWKFDSPNSFDSLQMKIDDNEKESDKQLNQSEIGSHNPKLINLKTKTRASTTGTVGDSILKNVHGNAITKSVKHKKSVVVKHFSGVKIKETKYYVKPTQEKQPVQMIETNLIKTSANNVAVFRMVSRKDQLTTRWKK